MKKAEDKRSRKKKGSGYKDPAESILNIFLIISAAAFVVFLLMGAMEPVEGEYDPEVAAADRAIAAGYHPPVDQREAEMSLMERYPDAIPLEEDRSPEEQMYGLPEGMILTEDGLVPEEMGEKEINQEDRYLLAHLICGEAQCCSWDCQVAVASVVLNRVASPHYPDTIYGVINQPHQYACIYDGNFDRAPTECNWEAAEYVLRHGSQIPADVVYQSMERQGSGLWKKIDSEYFCYE